MDYRSKLRKRKFRGDVVSAIVSLDVPSNISSDESDDGVSLPRIILERFDDEFTETIKIDDAQNELDQSVEFVREEKPTSEMLQIARLNKRIVKLEQLLKAAKPAQSNANENILVNENNSAGPSHVNNANQSNGGQRDDELLKSEKTKPSQSNANEKVFINANDGAGPSNVNSANQSNGGQLDDELLKSKTIKPAQSNANEKVLVNENDGAGPSHVNNANQSGVQLDDGLMNFSLSDSFIAQVTQDWKELPNKNIDGILQFFDEEYN